MPVFVIFLPNSQSCCVIVKAKGCVFLTKTGENHECPQQTRASHVNSPLLQGEKGSCSDLNLEYQLCSVTSLFHDRKQYVRWVVGYALLKVCQGFLSLASE